jgi:acetylornithine deacetylase/succinyl-diaminopimelate desuccinylase-like protein
LKSAEFLIDEGTGPRMDKDGNTIAYFVSLGEKSPLWLTITFRGEPGHGSRPMENSAVNRAIRAANRILEYQTEFVVLPGIRKELQRRLSKSGYRNLPGFKDDLATSLHNPVFLKSISADPEINPLIRNTIAITLLQGSDKINTIPNEARIGLDCRLLPGVDKDDFLRTLKGVMNDETAEIRVEEYIPATHSPANTAWMHALEKCVHERDPKAQVIPILLTSSTDSSYFRPLGVYAYGFEPYKLLDEEAALTHGNNERISVANVGFSILFLADILRELNR